MPELKCLRCEGKLKELPVPPDQAGMGTVIKTYACEKCGKMEFFMDVGHVKSLTGGLKDGNKT